MRTKTMFSLLLVASVLLVALSLSKYPQMPSIISNDPSYLPKAETARFTALGHTESFASLFWVSAVISYGDALLTGARYQWLIEVSNIVTTLDPYLREPYVIAGTTPGIPAKAPKLIQVLQRGTETFPGDWRIALYYSLLVVNADSNYDLASERMKAFANSDTVLPYVRRIYRTFLARSKPREESLLIYLDDYCTPKYAEFQKGLEMKIQETLEISDPKSKEDLHSILLSFAANPSIRPALFQKISHRWLMK